MNSPATPDFASYARQLGLTRTSYTVDEAFEHLSVKSSLGWKLIRQGLLGTPVRLTGKKTTVLAIDIAKLIWDRQQDNLDKLVP